MEGEAEKFFICPYCGESISMVLEELYGSQSYIEDCQISYEVEDGEVVNIQADRAQ